MTTVDIAEATHRLTALLDQVASGQQGEITITRDGKPVACLMAAGCPSRPAQRIGVEKGKFQMPADLDVSAEEAAVLLAAACALAAPQNSGLGNVISALSREGPKTWPQGSPPGRRNGIELLPAGKHSKPVTLEQVNRLRDGLP